MAATLLTEKDVIAVIGYLRVLSNQEIINIGVNLGLRYFKLRNMSPESLMVDMVFSWLRRDDDVDTVSAPPSWKTLCTALRKCGYNGIALSIERTTLQGPTKYILQQYLGGVAGSSPALEFSVDPPVPEDTEHILMKEGGEPVPPRFEVKHDRIIFHKLQETDSGEYIISCRDVDGELVKAILELNVMPSQPSASAAYDNLMDVSESASESLSRSELEFCANIEKHMRSSGVIDRFLAHLVFVGFPASGKTTLIYRLLNRAISIEASSTGVMDGIITVNIGEDKASMHAANVDERMEMCLWHKVEFSLSCLRQMGMLSSQLSHTPSHASQLREATDPAADYDPAADHDPAPSDHGPATEDSQPMKVVLATIQKTLQEKGYSADGFREILPYLSNKTTLYLSDTGGQVEFQELLPLLVAGCAIFLFLFPLNKDLDQPVRVRYRKKGGGKTNDYTSSLTIEESFLQTLSSIDSMQTDDPFMKQNTHFQHDSSMKHSSDFKHKPAVFVIGTHKDCLIKELGKAQAKTKIKTIEERIKELVKKHRYGELVMHANPAKEKILFAVSNVDKSDKKFQRIRSRIMTLIRKEDRFHIEFPLSYLLASMQLDSKKVPFVKRSDFATDVLQYGIVGEDIDHLLHFLHTRIGQIRYFPLEEIREDIVKEPQVLYDIVTHLITESFLLPGNVAQATEVKRGIYSLDFFKKYSDILSPMIIIALLKELRIVAPFFDRKAQETKIFIPCVLNHLEDPPEENASSIHPLAIMFNRGHCPKGMFGVLIHYLLNSRSRLVWNLNIEEIFRNQVSFEVGDYKDKVTIKFHTSYIEVRYYPKEHPQRNPEFTEKKICSMIRSVLISGIGQSIVSLRYSPEKTKYRFGLVCRECCSPHVVTEGGHSMQCPKQSNAVVPNPGSYWFENSSESVDYEGEGQNLTSDTESLSKSDTEPLSRSEAEFCANIEKHLKSSGAIDRFLAHLVFVGLPASGKTTLIARLLNLKVIMEASRSTGVMDGIITVSIGEDRATMHAANVDEQTSEKTYVWHQVDFDLSCLRQMGMLPVDKPSEDIDHGITTSHQEIVTEVTENDATLTSLSHAVPDLTPRVADPPVSDSVVSDHNRDNSTLRPVLKTMGTPIQSAPAKKVEGFTILLESIDTILREKGYSAEGFKKIRPFLKNKTTLYLSDTGGQIEFQELLPLFVAGYAIFLFLFPLNKDLDKPVRVSYRKQGGDETNVYTSSLTIEESFLQTLSSIDSMCISNDSSAAKGTKLQHKPVVFVIGTHKDCLIEELGNATAAEDKITKIDDRIHSLAIDHGYKDLVRYCSDGTRRVLFAVDNTKENEENDVFQKIRSRIMSIIHKEEKFHIKFPLSYLLASMHLDSVKEAFIKRSDFFQHVERYHIKEEDVDHLLRFLHNKIGQIRYFPLKEIRDDIVKKPQALYDVVTHLITESFLLPDGLQDSEVKRGIYSRDSFKKCSDKLPPDKIIALLQQLRIVAPFFDQEAEGTKFFIPCVLNHLEDPPQEDTSETSSIQPLAVMFDRKHCPKGMFGVLIHSLLTQDTSSSRLAWSLSIEKIFRGQVSFEVGCYKDEVTIKFHTAYIEVKYHPKEYPQRDPEFTEKKICNMIRSVLVSGIKQSIVSLRYSPEKTKYKFGLVCVKCCSAHEVPVEECSVNCPKQSNTVVPNPGSYWFEMPTFIFKNYVTLKEKCTPHRIPFSVAPCIDESSLKLSKDPKSSSKYRPIERQDCVKLDSGLTVCFKDLKKCDEGMYTISGRNANGCAEFSFLLSVKRRSKYILQQYLEDVAGKSPTLEFSVDPPVPEDTEHTLTIGDEKPAPARFEVKDDHIIFRKLKEKDSGEYIISCRDIEGDLVKETLELEVMPSQPSSQHAPPTHGTTPYPGYQQPPYQHGNNVPLQSQGHQPSHGQRFQYQQQQQQQHQPSPYEVEGEPLPDMSSTGKVAEAIEGGQTSSDTEGEPLPDMSSTGKVAEAIEGRQTSSDTEGEPLPDMSSTGKVAEAIEGGQTSSDTEGKVAEAIEGGQTSSDTEGRWLRAFCCCKQSSHSSTPARLSAAPPAAWRQYSSPITGRQPCTFELHPPRGSSYGLQPQHQQQYSPVCGFSHASTSGAAAQSNSVPSPVAAESRGAQPQREQQQPAGEMIVVRSEDVNFLMTYLYKNAYKWREIGSSLNFLHGELENIYQSYPRATMPQLLSILLNEWIQRRTDHHGYPTMEKLRDALRSNQVNLGAVADDLYAERNSLPSRKIL